MELLQFADKAELLKKTEIEKIELLAFFLSYYQDKKTFVLQEVTSILVELGAPISNISRLKQNISKSRSFRRIKEGEYLLTNPAKDRIKQRYACRLNDEQEIETQGALLDEMLICGKRGFIDKLVKQINHSYEYYCYDACAVCMRRVFEISLILAYENLGIQDEIKTNGEYAMLEKIVANAVCNNTLNLSRSKKEYNTIREIGNYAAHKVMYNTRKKDIDDIKQVYRTCLEELFYKAGLLQ